MCCIGISVLLVFSLACCNTCEQCTLAFSCIIFTALCGAFAYMLQYHWCFALSFTKILCFMFAYHLPYFLFCTTCCVHLNEFTWLKVVQVVKCCVLSNFYCVLNFLLEGTVVNYHNRQHQLLLNKPFYWFHILIFLKKLKTTFYHYLRMACL